MTYTFVSARYANGDNTAAIADTEEVGSVALSVVDTPEAWQALLGSGVQIQPYNPPPDPATLTAVNESYKAGLRRKADTLAGKGLNYDAFKLLLRAQKDS